MKSTKIIIASVSALLFITAGTVAVRADSKTPDHPNWVHDDGKVNLSQVPDNADIPYQCWNGKNIKLTGKQYKVMAGGQAKPGSDEYNEGVAKTNELKHIRGAVTTDGDGNETVNIDDNNPAIVNVMKKYEKKEMPQCQ